MTETQTDMGEQFTIHQSLSECSIFLPTSHQAISNLSIDLDSLGQAEGNKIICKVIGLEMGE